MWWTKSGDLRCKVCRCIHTKREAKVAKLRKDRFRRLLKIAQPFKNNFVWKPVYSERESEPELELRGKQDNIPLDLLF